MIPGKNPHIDSGIIGMGCPCQHYQQDNPRYGPCQNMGIHICGWCYRNCPTEVNVKMSMGMDFVNAVEGAT